LCIETCLRLLHPFMPFLTEELYHEMPHRVFAPESIMIARYPTSNNYLKYNDSKMINDFEQIKKLCDLIRSVKHDVLGKVNLKYTDTNLYIKFKNLEILNIYTKYRYYVGIMTWSYHVQIVDNFPSKLRYSNNTCDLCEIGV